MGMIRRFSPLRMGFRALTMVKGRKQGPYTIKGYLGIIDHEHDQTTTQAL
jgi:hypothetical protein